MTGRTELALRAGVFTLAALSALARGAVRADFVVVPNNLGAVEGDLQNA